MCDVLGEVRTDREFPEVFLVFAQGRMGILAWKLGDAISLLFM